jgi:hypothetical protein
MHGVWGQGTSGVLNALMWGRRFAASGPSGAVRAPPNNRVKLEVRAVTSLAESASAAPARPAADAERWAEATRIQ